MKTCLLNKIRVFGTKNLLTLVMVIIIVFALTSTPKSHNKDRHEVIYYWFTVENNDAEEQRNDLPEVEVVSVFELAGTYYGEAIGAELINENFNN